MLGLELRLPRVWPKIRPFPYVLNNAKADPESALMFTIGIQSNSGEFGGISIRRSNGSRVNGLDSQHVATTAEGDELTGWGSFWSWD